ncbi:hypothetical protein [Paracidovorax wautersii]
MREMKGSPQTSARQHRAKHYAPQERGKSKAFFPLAWNAWT